MNNKTLWAILGVIVVVGCVVCVTQLSAQREPPRPEIVPLQPPMVGRFVVARVEGSKIILLDTATGDLYRATEDDFKRYSARPRIAPIGPRPFVEKDGPRDRPFRDRSEKDRFKRDADKRDSKRDGDRPFRDTTKDSKKRDFDKEKKSDDKRDSKREFPKDQKFEKKEK